MTPDWLKDYALRFVGVRYQYGGKCPLQGLDCSGLVSEILEAAGAIPFGFQTNAQGLHDFFLKDREEGGTGFGALAFFGKGSNAIDHVGFCLSETHMLEAGGGHPQTLNLAAAIEANAFVKVRPIHYRKDYLEVVMPKYSWLE